MVDQLSDRETFESLRDEAFLTVIVGSPPIGRQPLSSRLVSAVTVLASRLLKLVAAVFSGYTASTITGGTSARDTMYSLSPPFSVRALDANSPSRRDPSSRSADDSPSDFRAIWSLLLFWFRVDLPSSSVFFGLTKSPKNGKYLGSSCRAPPPVTKLGVYCEISGSRVCRAYR